MTTPLLTVDRLHEVLDYNPETGVFTRRVTRPGRVAGSVNSTGYLQIEIGGRTYCAHRLAWLYTYGEWPPNELDHINRNKSDNRISNLRPATRQQNCWNTRRHFKTKPKGVSFEPQRRGKKYRASIQGRERRLSLGLFNTAEEAHAAYKAAALTLFGEFFCDGDDAVDTLPHGKTFSEHAGSSA